MAGALANNLCSIEHFQIATIPARIDTEHTVATEQWESQRESWREQKKSENAWNLFE